MCKINSPIHPRWPRRAIGVVLGICLSLVSAHAEDGQSAAVFRRGIGIAHVLAWAPVEAPPSRRFVFPPFEESPTALANELKALRDSGFDFIRLAVDPGPFLQFQGSQRDHLDDLLMNRVRLALSSGLAVIVDFHPSDLHEDYTSTALTRELTAPVFQAYLRLLAHTATLLAGLHSRGVALEIMNEPPVPPGRWQSMLEAAYGAIRDRTPGLPLVLDGGDEGSADGMVALGKFSTDPAVIFSYHYYDPYQFTHQGSPWVAARYLADVPYPALSRPLQDSLAASTAAIAARDDLSSAQRSFAIADARQRLESYRRSCFDRGTIAGRFDRIASWARDHGVPPNRIILGEFGAVSQHGRLGALRNAERERWIRDVREEAEARGFIWAAWVYRGSGGFSLLKEDEGTELDPAVVAALGLNQR
jgi:hypothetical protein